MEFGHIGRDRTNAVHFSIWKELPEMMEDRLESAFVAKILLPEHADEIYLLSLPPMVRF